ncbi:MAG: tRNA threonylcarbamoyladenosine dehydratase [Clostridia bacterium]|nr:tRNA threonylcarbamoyladenosine dehydratase [Clostridia bacterium]
MEREAICRTAELLGDEAVEKLSKASVIVFGIGGVGSFAAEALARSGIGRLALVDFDRVSVSNINRQIIALHSTVGMFKTEVMAERIKDINPDAEVREYRFFYGDETESEIDLSEYDFIVDAVDSVRTKLMLAGKAIEKSVGIISSMGTGNKTDPSRFRICDIRKTSVCPLARSVRTQLKKRGIDSLTVLFSDEKPARAKTTVDAPASCSFVPSVAGLMIAGHVIREISKTG